MSDAAPKQLAGQDLSLEEMERHNSPHCFIAVCLLSLLALALRLPGLAGDLWIDEVATLENFVRLPLSKIVSTYHSANNHILYSVLAHISVRWFGETEQMLRLPAMLFGVATVPVFYYLAISVTTRREALAATFLLAVSSHHVYFSQNARGYTGYLFFSVMSTAFLIRALSGDRPGHWAGFVLSSVANMYIHLNGVFVLGAQAVGTLILYVLPVGSRTKNRVLRRRFYVSIGAIGLLVSTLYAPIVFSAFALFGREYADMGWRPSFGLLQVILRDVAPGVTGAVALSLALPIGVVGLVSIARTAPLLLYVSFLPPLLTIGIATILGTGTYPRFFLILLPFAALLGVRGLRVASDWVVQGFVRYAGSAVLGHRLFITLILVSAVVASSGLPRLYTLPKQDYTGALAFVRSKRLPADLVAAAYITVPGARYYDPTVLSARTADDLQKILAGRVPVWLLGTFIADMRTREPQLASTINMYFREVRRFPGIVGDGTIVVWKSVEP